MRCLLHVGHRASLPGIALAMFLVSAVAEETPKSDSVDAASVVAKDFTSTHKQARIIKPLYDGQPIVLNTYCLDREGNILACVGSDTFNYVANADGTQQAQKLRPPKLLQVYSPDGDLLRTTELTFEPTAINQAPDGSVFVAGAGKVAHVSIDGKVLTTVDSPHIGDLDSFKERIEEGAKKQIEEMTTTYRDQVTRIEERIAKLKEKPEAEITERDTKRIATYEQQKSMYQDQLTSMEASYTQAFSGEQMLSRKLGITALAVTSKDLFLCCNAIEGYGYEVWRMTHEFSEPTKVVDQLGGCCGQCDIQATEENLVLAENTKFQVGLLDRDGTRLTGFGKGDRKAVDGFGSCCNPMNVRCCDNGDILTAESSIGTIKRFSKDGELLGVVGKAKIGGGCKHVALDFDAKRNRYYMMNVDKSHICVLVPNAEAPEITPDELLAKAAREGLGQKLIGEWSLNGTKPSAKTAGAGTAELSVIGAIALALSGGSDASAEPLAESVAVRNDPYATSHFQFHADGKLTMTGGQFAAGDNAWEAVRQDGNTLIVAQIQDTIQYYDYKIEFVSDDEATISMMFNERVMTSNRFKRVREESVAPPAEKPAVEPAAAVESDKAESDSVPATGDQK